MAVTKSDVEAAFLQTEPAERDVCVRLPVEKGDRRHYWLLWPAAYGLVNANSKFPPQADDLIFSIGLSHLAVLPQMFYLLIDRALVLITLRVVEDLLTYSDRRAFCSSKFPSSV